MRDTQTQDVNVYWTSNKHLLKNYFTFVFNFFYIFYTFKNHIILYYIFILFQKMLYIASLLFILIYIYCQSASLKMSQSDEDKCGECAPFIICSRRHMGEWHVLNEKLVQMLLTHFYSTHDLDDTESVQTYCEHLHLFFTVHWLNRNVLTITWLACSNPFQTKKTSQTHIDVSPIAPEQDIDFCILNHHCGSSQFSTHHCSWVTVNYSQASISENAVLMYVITIRDWIHIHGLLSWLDSLIGFGVTPCVTVPHADSLWSWTHASLWYWERDMPLVSCLIDVKQAWTHIRGLFPFHIYLQHMCCFAGTAV